MPHRRALILGGTGEARALAQALIEAGFDVVTSLAGVTSSPMLPGGMTRRGGFGGEAGIAEYVRRENIAAIADASHPFAAQISRHADAAARATGIAYARLERPPWAAEAGDTWIEVASVAEAVAVLPSAARAFVTIGRKEIEPFFARPDIAGVARMIEAPAIVVPERWTLVLARPPFSLKDECQLIATRRITHVVSKNAGGEETRAKLLAAREQNIPVVMIGRPPKPDAPTYSSIEALIRSFSA